MVINERRKNTVDRIARTKPDVSVPIRRLIRHPYVGQGCPKLFPDEFKRVCLLFMMSCFAGIHEPPGPSRSEIFYLVRSVNPCGIV